MQSTLCLIVDSDSDQVNFVSFKSTPNYTRLLQIGYLNVLNPFDKFLYVKHMLAISLPTVYITRVYYTFSVTAQA